MGRVIKAADRDRERTCVFRLLPASAADDLDDYLAELPADADRVVLTAAIIRSGIDAVCGKH